LYESFFLDSRPVTALPPEANIADVVNAAWLWRLSLTHETAELVEERHLRASELCREIMARRSPPLKTPALGPAANL
jgi:hypothetical protein